MGRWRRQIRLESAQRSAFDLRRRRYYDVVVELYEPVLVGSDLTYRVDVLDGELPASGGPSSLFIDIIGRPLSPVSVAGARRRDRRRDRR